MRHIVILIASQLLMGMAVAAESQNIYGLKLNMTLSEVESALKKFENKNYIISYRKKETPAPDSQPYVEQIEALNKAKGNAIKILFSKPPRESKVSSIYRKKAYQGNDDELPYFEEVAKYMIKKYGNPIKILDFPLNPVFLWADYKCDIQRMNPSWIKRIIKNASKNYRTYTVKYMRSRLPATDCGELYAGAYSLVDRGNGDIRVVSFFMELSDMTAIIKNNKDFELFQQRLFDQRQKLLRDEKRQRLKNSTFSDDL